MSVGRVTVLGKAGSMVPVTHNNVMDRLDQSMTMQQRCELPFNDSGH
jgi:hypothetical protein